jgi:SPP1 gp7 family putative phage head morphogenesis protein
LGFSGSKTGGGSFALGKEQFKAFLGVIKKDRESLQNKITERMLKPLVTVNWGEEIAKTVSFQFVPFSDESIVDGARLWTEAVKAGMWVPTDEEINHLRGITGFPEGEVERKPEPMQFDPEGNPIEPANGTKPGLPGGKKPKPGEDEEEDEEATEKPKFKPQGARAFSLRTYTHRKMTRYEKKVDFEGVVNILDMSERRVMPSLRRAAKTIYNDLITQVREKGFLTRFRPEAINDLKPKHLKDMNMVFRNHFTDLFKGAVKGAKDEIYKDVKGYAKDDDPMLPEDFLRVLQAETFKVVGDYTMEITKKAKNILMQGIKDGVAEAEIVGLLRDEMDEYTERWLSTVVRTKTTEIYNDARKSFWDSDPIAKQVIEAYQFSAILDDRTTDVCRELDGQIFEKGDFLNTITPPLHFNCRSLLVPVTRFEAYRDDPDYVKPGKEPSMDKLKEQGGGFIVGGD